MNNVFEGYSALYDVLVVGTLAYAASYFARGWLAGHQYFALFGGLVLMESISRICFALAAALGITSGQTAVALGIAAAPFVSLVVVPAAFARRGATHDAATSPGRSPATGAIDETDAALTPASDHRGRGRRGAGRPGHRGRPGGRRPRRGALAAPGRGLRAVWVSGIMLSEQTILNAAVLTVDATSPEPARSRGSCSTCC